jgi:hypothetical protein
MLCFIKLKSSSELLPWLILNLLLPSLALPRLKTTPPFLALPLILCARTLRRLKFNMNVMFLNTDNLSQRLAAADLSIAFIRNSSKAKDDTIKMLHTEYEQLNAKVGPTLTNEAAFAGLKVALHEPTRREHRS